VGEAPGGGARMEVRWRRLGDRDCSLGDHGGGRPRAQTHEPASLTELREPVLFWTNRPSFWRLLVRFL
jgi:hypothetical protein